MSDCSKHKKSVGPYTDMSELAEDIGNLHYETLSDLMVELSNKLERDGMSDKERGRPILSNHLLMHL